jgi:ABC-2 type transport system ATP-binding protein
MKEINNVIELKNVVKDYGDFKLDHISFAVPEGSVCGFIGQNGAGKTTTINLILDIINRDEGEISLFGKPVDKDHAYVREDVGVVFDEMGFHEFMTAKDINIMMKNIYKNWDEVAFFDYLKKFSLPSKKKCGAFSRGMRMKLQIAVAMSHKAKLLIMDEPFVGLDPKAAFVLKEIMREMIAEGSAIFFSTHVLEVAEKLCDRIMIISHGKNLYQGTIEGLSGQYPGMDLEEIFIRMTGGIVDSKDETGSVSNKEDGR